MEPVETTIISENGGIELTNEEMYGGRISSGQPGNAGSAQCSQRVELEEIWEIANIACGPTRQHPFSCRDKILNCG
jgi:hypothetical protein